MKKYRVVLAEGSVLFAESLRTVIDREPDFNVISGINTGIDAIKAVLEERPDIAVAGQFLPDITMFQVVREVRRLVRGTKILFIIRNESSELASFLSGAGNIGVIRDDSPIAEFMTALRSVARGERYISMKVLRNLKSMPDVKEERDPLINLSRREREVLYWLASGQTNEEIARTMILSELTVKNHVSHILRKLGVQDRTKAAATAWRDGLPLIPEEFFSSGGVAKGPL